MATQLSEIRTELNNLADETIDSTKANKWINRIYHFVASKYRWNWLENSGTFSLTASDYDYTFPTDAKHITSMRIKGSLVDFRSNQYMEEHHPEFPEYDDYSSTPVGRPLEYTVYNNSEVRFYPIPDQTYTARYKYQKLITELSGDTDEPLIPDRWREVLVLGAFWKWLIADEADPGQIGDAKRNFDNMLNEMIAEEEAVGDQTVESLGWNKPEI